MRDDSTEIVCQSFLMEAIVNGSDVHAMTLIARHFLPDEHGIALRMVLESLSWRLT